jgi:hypothetical protein
VVLHAGNTKKLAGEVILDIGKLFTFNAMNTSFCEQELHKMGFKKDLMISLSKCPDPKGAIAVSLKMKFLQVLNDDQNSIYDHSTSKMSSASCMESPAGKELDTRSNSTNVEARVLFQQSANCDFSFLNKRV